MILLNFLAGITYQASYIILITNCHKPCSRSAFFAKQKEICPKIESIGNSLVKEARDDADKSGNEYYTQNSLWSSQYHGK